MGKIFKVIQREYLVSVRTKGFIIGTLIVPIIMIGFMVLPIIFTQVRSEKQQKISVIDETGVIYDEFATTLDDKLNDGRKKYLLNRVKVGTGGIEDIDKELRVKVTNNEIDGYIYINKDVFKNKGIDYYARNVTNLIENRRIQNALNRAVVKQRILKEGFEPSVVMKLTQNINFRAIRIAEGEKREGGEQTFFIAYLFMLVLYMTILLYGQFVMQSVMEEKKSRVVEVLLSSLRPFDLMAGKILGMNLVGFTQYLVWAVFAILIFSFGESIMTLFIEPSVNLPDIPSIPPIIFVYLIIFFILGYLLFSGLFATLGAIFNNESEARSYVFVILIPLLLPILMMVYIIGNPDSLLTIILSLIPFTSPIIMLSRICVSSPPIIEIAGSILILILTIVAEIWVVSKIYRVGILMYGKKPKIGEVLKWIKYS